MLPRLVRSAGISVRYVLHAPPPRHRRLHIVTFSAWPPFFLLLLPRCIIFFFVVLCCILFYLLDFPRYSVNCSSASAPKRNGQRFWLRLGKSGTLRKSGRTSPELGRTHRFVHGGETIRLLAQSFHRNPRSPTPRRALGWLRLAADCSYTHR